MTYGDSALLQEHSKFRLWGKTICKLQLVMTRENLHNSLLILACTLKIDLLKKDKKTVWLRVKQKKKFNAARQRNRSASRTAIIQIICEEYYRSVYTKIFINPSKAATVGSGMCSSSSSWAISFRSLLDQRSSSLKLSDIDARKYDVMRFIVEKLCSSRWKWLLKLKV